MGLGVCGVLLLAEFSPLRLFVTNEYPWFVFLQLVQAQRFEHFVPFW